MLDIFDAIPDGYEIVRTISSAGSVGEYIARHQEDDALVRLRIFNFTPTSGTTTRRHFREHLRCDITFMEELEHPGIIKLFDYSDTKGLFWIATQPAEVNKLSEQFDFLSSQPLEFRVNLVRQFLSILQQIHNSRIVHRNLSSDAVFLSPEQEIYIGDFGFASYLTDRPTTRLQTGLVATTSYLPPEVRNAHTFTCNVSCDIFSAGLLVLEIVSATPLPRDRPDEIHEVVRGCLNEQLANQTINIDTAEAILKASNPSPDKRWPNMEDFANAIEASLQSEHARSSVLVSSTSTIAIIEPAEQKGTAPVPAATEATQQPHQPVPYQADAADVIKPLDPSHEIWNNHYEIIEKIGEGGQAIVYKAYDHLTNEEIAIKTIWSRHRGDRAAINRLKQGAMIARSLTHRHIIKTYSVEQRTDTDSLGKHVFICMELVGSQLDLGNVIEARKTSGQKIRLDETLHIIRQLLDALMYAHEYTIHRDIKPGNIMLVPRDEQTGTDISDLTKFDIKLIDFGIAKVLSQKHIDVTGKGFRSAYYGAPELADARTGVDARADIYSVGVIMYQMLTKNIPRKGSPPANKVNKDVPVALANVIDRSINTDREKRFKTTLELTKEIERAVSKFNWVRKAAKVAAVLIVGISIAGAVKHYLPEPDYGFVQQSMGILESRIPERQIAALADETPIQYSDIADYGAYDGLRQTALENLKVVEMAGNNKFNKRSFSPWRDQEQVWLKIEPAINKIENIAQDQRKYNNRRDLAVAVHLMKLDPSSKIVSEVTDKANTAETLLEERPLSQNKLDICADSYDLAANIYANIETLSGGSDTPEAARQINEKLKVLEKLRNASLLSHDALEEVQPLKDHGFHEHSVKCIEKADRYYNTFELNSATKYYSLLGQICGTMANVREQVDFSRSNIGLISSRLMELCNEDIETFENYPAWKEKLEQVYKKKDIAAKYTLIRSLLLNSPKDAPLTVYELAASALQQYQQGNPDSAVVELDNAAEQYKTFMRRKIGELILDCDSLSTFSTVSAEDMESCKIGLEKLSNSIAGSSWPKTDFAEEYNSYSARIKSRKDTVRQQLSENARHLKQKIVDSKNKAQQQSFFWKSARINKFIAVAQQYDSEDIDASIENWKYVEDLSRLSTIVNLMKNMDSLLGRMLARKDQMDRLASDIDEAIAFCQKFKGVSADEKEKYKQWESDLTQIRSRLTAPQNNVYLIDQTDEIFTAEHGDIQSAFSEIRAKLPFHRNRVIELINKTRSLENSAADIGRLHQHWAGIIVDSNSPSVKPDFDQIRAYLEGVKEAVDNWPPDRFNQQMSDKCNALADALNRQSRTMTFVISAIRNEKSGLIEGIESFEKRVNEILGDQDIRSLDEIAASDRRQKLLKFRELPALLVTTKKKVANVVLAGVTTPANILSENNLTAFEVDTWLIDFNTNKDQIDAQITQLQAIEDTVSIFQETRKLLAQQSSIEADYYLALRDHALGLIDYSDASSKLDAAAADSATVKMCNFLEQMKNDAVPGLEGLRTSVATISKELTNLKSARITTLSEARDFNGKREQLLDRIAALRQGIDKLDRTNLESSCKQTIVTAVAEIRNLMGNPSQNAKLNDLTSSLWAFFPDHRNWSQWSDFLQLFHVVVSDEDILLSTSNLLRVVTQKGDALNVTAIAASPTKFFHVEATDSVNFGWPHYISHQKDPTVILAFIPGTNAAGSPFYMAVREITNTQYRLFMANTGVKSSSSLAGWSYFSDQSNSLLIGQAQGQFPPCRITWDKSANTFILDENFTNAPVTWVTLHGARSYAQWLDAQIPTSSQHTHAARAGTSTKYPWGDELTNAADYAHLRSIVWQNAARDYNAKRDNPTEIAYPPVGAIRDFLREEALDPAKIVHSQNNNLPVWPCFTVNNKPNAWGLYDMLGNVWEWCIDAESNSSPSICGGSCLCPPEYVGPESKRQFNAQACDVGFRIVIPAK